MKCPTCNTDNTAGSIQCVACLSPLAPLASLQDAPTIAPATRMRASGAHEQWPEREEGSYQVVELAGQGGMGEVWIVRDQRNGLLRCLKRPSRATGGDLARFLAEIEILKGKLCGDIVPCIDYGRDRKGPFLIMPFYQRGSLQKRISEEGPLLGTSIFDLAKAIGRALCHLHQANVLHRDVKPANILLTDDGQPCLADFGLARTDEDGSNEAHGPVGTANYMAPEVSRGDTATAVSDIYSLGVTLRFAITGCPPGSGRDERIPEPWRTVVLRCTEPRPGDRFQSAADFLATVDSLRFSSTSATGKPCHACGAETAKGALHCPDCAAALTESCGSCQSSVPRGTINCTSCGANIPTWNQVRALRQQAEELVNEAQFARAAALLDKMLEVLPAARGLTLTTRSQIARISPMVSQWRREARKVDFERGPREGRSLWQRILGQCPSDKESLEAVKEAELRQVAFEFEVAKGELLQDCSDLDLDAAKKSLIKLQSIAETAQQVSECTRLQTKIGEARTRLQTTMDEAFVQATAAGNFAGAASLLAQCVELGVAPMRIASMRQQLARIRRSVWKRDLMLVAAVLGLAAIGSVWFVWQSDAVSERSACRAFAARDFSAALAAIESMFFPSELAITLASDARTMRNDREGGIAPEQIWRMEQRWQQRRDNEEVHAVVEMLARALDATLLIAVGIQDPDVPASVYDERLQLTPLPGMQLALTLLGRDLPSAAPGEFQIAATLADGEYSPMLMVTAAELGERQIPLRIAIRRAPIQITVLGSLPENAPIGTSVPVRIELDRVRDLDALRLDAIASGTATVSRPRPVAENRLQWTFEVRSAEAGVVTLELRVSEGTRQATLPLTMSFLAPVVAKPVAVAPQPRSWRLLDELPVATKDNRLQLRVSSTAKAVWLQRISTEATTPTRRPFERKDDSWVINASLQTGSNELAIIAQYGEEEPQQVERWSTTLDDQGPTLISSIPPRIPVDADLMLDFDEPITAIGTPQGTITGTRLRWRAPSQTGRYNLRVTVADALGTATTVSHTLLVFDVVTVGREPRAERHLAAVATRRQLWTVTPTSARSIGDTDDVAIEGLDIRHFAATEAQLCWLDQAQHLHFIATRNGPHWLCKVIPPDEQCLALGMTDSLVLMVTKRGDTWQLRSVDPIRSLTEAQPLGSFRPAAGEQLAQLVIGGKRWAIRTNFGKFLYNSSGQLGGWSTEFSPRGEAQKGAPVATTAIASGAPDDSMLLATADQKVWMRKNDRTWREVARVNKSLTAIGCGSKHWLGIDGDGSCLQGRYDSEATENVELPSTVLAVAFAGTGSAERALVLLADGRIVTFDL